MFVSQKSQYALRAIFELAKRNGKKQVKIAEIARAQAIPLRFLQVILSQLKRGGFVASRRGNAGGYLLVRSPEELTVGEVIRFVQGPLGPVSCVTEEPRGSTCPFHGRCVFLPLWERVGKAIAGVCDNTTFRDLVEQEMDIVGVRDRQFPPRSM